MIDVTEALAIILSNHLTLPTETIPIEEAYGRVLKEDLCADRDFPPFDRVAMDGIAINFELFSKGIRQFPIQGICPAGTEQQTLQSKAHCLEVMTGCVLPEGTDTVIRYEDLHLQNGHATIMIDSIRDKQNVHHQAKDLQKGALLIPSGTTLWSSEIAVAATIGASKLSVSSKPKVALVSTGDELIDVAQTPLPHQIRKSNIHQLSSVLLRKGIVADSLHLADDKVAIHKTLSKCLEEKDVIILSGAVSKGKLDFVPEVLEALGVEKLFHKVRQRPGKPFWFGRKDGCVVFAFPGNPISSFACMQKYFTPWLAKTLGQQREQVYAELIEDVDFKPDLHYLIEVNVSSDKSGKLIALPQKGNGSGDLANLLKVNAFMELPRGKDKYLKGTSYPIIWFDR